MTTRLRTDGKLRGVALRDQVAAALAELCDTFLAVNPGAICARLGTYHLWSVNCCDPECSDPAHTRDLGQRRYTAEDIRPALRRLEADGLAERHVPDGRSGRPHYWRWIGPPPTVTDC